MLPLPQWLGLHLCVMGVGVDYPAQVSVQCSLFCGGCWASTPVSSVHRRKLKLRGTEVCACSPSPDGVGGRW